MTTRRSVLAGAAVGGLALAGGCIGFVTGSEPLTFDADPAAPSSESLEATGYSLADRIEERIEETISFAGIERRIEASYAAAVYTKSVSVGDVETDGAAFAAVSMPAMEVLGTAYNPVADMDGRELLEEALDVLDDEYGEIRDLRHDGTKRVEVLGSARDVDVFEGTTEFEGRDVDVRLYVVVVESDGDLVVCFGGHPEQLPEEEYNVEDLLASVEHPVDAIE